MENRFTRFLKDEYHRRKQRNEQYSLRVFAKHLNISKSSLHNVVAGGQTLSFKMQTKVFDQLNVSNEERAFILEGNEASSDQIDDAQFSEIYHWWYFAILSLSEMPEVRACAVEISSSLGVEKAQAQSALDKLLEMKMVEVTKEGYLRRLNKPIRTATGISSRPLKLFHVENLHRAERAIFETAVQDREVSSATFLTDKKQFEKAKKKIGDFILKTMKLAEQASVPDRVCTLAVQFFPQTNLQQDTK